jgi:hypothetical protein
MTQDALPEPLPELSLSPSNRTAMHYLTSWRDADDPDPFDLDAPYQRGAVWTVEQRRNLIRSLIMGVPIGAVIVAHQGYETQSTYRVVDGQQRIRALRAWVAGEFAVPGWWWHATELADGEAARGRDVTIADLSVRGRRTVDSWPVPTIETNAASIPHRGEDGSWKWVDLPAGPERDAWEAELYLLVNFGGVPQTDEDRARAAEVAGR